MNEEQPYSAYDAFPNCPGLSKDLGLTKATETPAPYKDGRQWFSICSRHQRPTEGCELCLVGSYRDEK